MKNSIEIEVKCKIADNIERIRELLGEPTEVVKEVDYYFNSPVRDFSKSDEALRVRVSISQEGGKRVEITYKGPKIDSITKSREEITIELSKNVSEATAMMLLEKLGFRLVGIVEKTREIYIGDSKMKIYLDNVSGIINGIRIHLGYFIEVEIIGVHSHENIKKVLNQVRDLGCSEIIRESYLELLMEAVEKVTNLGE